MQTRQLGQTDLQLTTIGMGTWAIGGPWEFGWGPQNDDDSISAITTAIDSGVNWIDTAPAYGCGHGEEIVGRVLKLLGDRPIVATKCGLLWNDKRQKLTCLKARSVIAECEASLKRLGIDEIDLYQIHWPDPDEQLEEGWEAMVKLKEQGKVRYIGACNFTVSQLERAGAIYPPVSLQPPYSMIRREAEDELFPYCKEHNMGVVAYSPMQKGLLTGKYTPEKVAQLAPDDHRHRDGNFHGEKLQANLKLVEGITEIAKQYDKTAAQLAIGWVLRREEVTAAIVGARNKRQIEETVQAGDWQPATEDMAAIDELIRQHAEQMQDL